MRPEAAGLNLLGHGRAWWLAAAIVGLTVVPRVAVAQQSLTLPEEAGFGSVANLSCASGTISVVSATYGANVWFVGAGNATSQLAASCNGQTSCSYPVYYWVLNDPAYGYA